MKALFAVLSFGFILLKSAVAIQAEERAPAFRLDDTEGRPVDLSVLLGQETVLLDFWATYCRPCLSELNDFRALQERYASQGLRIVAVSVDQPQTSARVRAFAKSQGFPFTVVTDPSQIAYRQYDASALPTTVLINKAGRIVWRREGYQPGGDQELEARLIAALRSSRVDSAVKAQTDSSIPVTSNGQVTSSPAMPGPSPMPPAWLSQTSLSGANFLRANYGRERRDQPDPNGWFEDWFDMRIADGNLAYQMRYRAYQFLENLPGDGETLIRDPNHRVVKQEFTYAGDHVAIQAGNIYGNVGRGLLFRFFEDRNARLDKDLNGLRAALQGGDTVGWGRGRISVFGGNTFSKISDLHTLDAQENALRDLYLQGAEGEWNVRPGLQFGGQAAEAFKDGWSARMLGGNAGFNRGPTDIYVGYMGVTGEDKFNYPRHYSGRAVYASLAENFGPFEAGMEYKHYYDYDLGFTDPPSLVQYHTFRLMARDMLFPNNQAEDGVQFRAAWHFSDKAAYAANLSRILSHPERNPALLIHHVELPFLDWDQQLRLPWKADGSILFDVDYDAQRKFSEGNFEDIQAYNGAISLENPVGGFVLSSEMEAQYRRVETQSVIPGDPLSGRLGEVGEVILRPDAWQAVVSATLAKASRWSFTLDYEVTTSPVESDPNAQEYKLAGLTNGWSSAYLTLSMLRNQQISLWAGQRKDRVVCSGGSCRVEPAFEGTELIWTSHF